MSITNIAAKENFKLDDIPLEYHRTYEEEMEERRKIDLAIEYLERLGVKTTTEYGYYRNSYNILKDLGEYLAKSNIT